MIHALAIADVLSILRELFARLDSNIPSLK